MIVQASDTLGGVAEADMLDDGPNPATIDQMQRPWSRLRRWSAPDFGIGILLASFRATTISRRVTSLPIA
jgi:hypothetical protein